MNIEATLLFRQLSGERVKTVDQIYENDLCGFDTRPSLLSVHLEFILNPCYIISAQI